MTVRRPPTRVGGALSSLGLVGLVSLTGCAGFAGSAPAAAPTTTGTTSSAPTTAPATTTAVPTYELPETCAGLLTSRQLDDALGARLPGTSTYVVGTPEPGIGRTGRVTCGFGVTPATATAGASDPLLEVSVFTYTDAAAADERLEALTAVQEGHGVPAGTAAVPGAQSVLFAGPADTTLVATVEARTVSVTLVPGLLDAAGTRTALERLAAAVLGTAPAATTSPQAERPAGTSGPTSTG
ncbi:hypothetical protein SAMN03159343_2438 [Klenkia marina]|uniref:DUF3558 domain-containing protein n=1 Tax=Klenkia marina TaxID=1960309 RepID=A0A1G4YB71_9ACTN|nr:hypothetical protein [Klenkia marina]SCX50595.1 hypothetical protein SAMN03159343_2438 [Klenkia marina]